MDSRALSPLSFLWATTVFALLLLFLALVAHTFICAVAAGVRFVYDVCQENADVISATLFLCLVLGVCLGRSGRSWQPLAAARRLCRHLLVDWLVSCGLETEWLTAQVADRLKNDAERAQRQDAVLMLRAEFDQGWAKLDGLIGLNRRKHAALDTLASEIFRMQGLSKDPWPWAGSQLHGPGDFSADRAHPESDLVRPSLKYLWGQREDFTVTRLVDLERRYLLALDRQRGVIVRVCRENGELDKEIYRVAAERDVVRQRLHALSVQASVRDDDRPIFRPCEIIRKRRPGDRPTKRFGLVGRVGLVGGLAEVVTPAPAPPVICRETAEKQEGDLPRQASASNLVDTVEEDPVPRPVQGTGLTPRLRELSLFCPASVVGPQRIPEIAVPEAAPVVIPVVMEQRLASPLPEDDIVMADIAMADIVMTDDVAAPARDDVDMADAGPVIAVESSFARADVVMADPIFVMPTFVAAPTADVVGEIEMVPLPTINQVQQQQPFPILGKPLFGPAQQLGKPDGQSLMAPQFVASWPATRQEKQGREEAATSAAMEVEPQTEPNKAEVGGMDVGLVEADVDAMVAAVAVVRLGEAIQIADKAVMWLYRERFVKNGVATEATKTEWLNPCRDFITEDIVNLGQQIDRVKFAMWLDGFFMYAVTHDKNPHPAGRQDQLKRLRQRAALAGHSVVPGIPATTPTIAAPAAGAADVNVGSEARAAVQPPPPQAQAPVQASAPPRSVINTVPSTQRVSGRKAILVHRRMLKQVRKMLDDDDRYSEDDVGRWWDEFGVTFDNAEEAGLREDNSYEAFVAWLDDKFTTWIGVYWPNRSEDARADTLEMLRQEAHLKGYTVPDWTPASPSKR